MPAGEENALIIPPGGTTLHLEATGATSIVLSIDGRPPQKYDLLPGSALSWRIVVEGQLHVEHPNLVTIRLGETPVTLNGRTDIDFRRAAAGEHPPAGKQ